eukprot:6212849-Pleurochrysis_carterae.AAC.2
MHGEWKPAADLKPATKTWFGKWNLSLEIPLSYISIYWPGILESSCRHDRQASCSEVLPMKRSLATMMKPFGVTQVNPIATACFDLWDLCELRAAIPMEISSTKISVPSPIATTFCMPQSINDWGAISTMLSKSLGR